MATTLPTFTLTPVNSSRLAAIGYDCDDFALYVQFPPTKNAPRGKIYRYDAVSEEVFDDLKNAASIGSFFGAAIVNHPEKYPFTCIDDGTGEPVAETAPAPPAQAAVAPPEILSPEIPDDEAGLKTRAMATRTEATAITISTADECASASVEVLRIRTERKLVTEKINRIKEPAAAAWKAACALFNEVDGRYAEAESYLDQGILAYRAAARRKALEETAARERIEREAREKAEREQREEYQRRMRAAEAEAAEKAAQLADQDAKAAEAQGAPAEVVQQIRDNPLPVTVQHVAPPVLAYVAPPPPSVVQYEIPKVEGLSYTTEWMFEVIDEAAIPLSLDYYTLDTKKIAARVKSLKKHANIPGVRVWSEEKARKRVS